MSPLLKNVWAEGGRWLMALWDVTSMAGDGCALAVRAGTGVDLRCLVAGPEENKKQKSVRFSAQKL